MSFDIKALREAVAEHGRIVRVVIAEVHGSVPREAGASMLVWSKGQGGTIGGGALEHEAAERARALVADRIDRVPLGPSLGQCCGGAVVLVSEIYDSARVAALTGPFQLRGIGSSAELPMSIRRRLQDDRSAKRHCDIAFEKNWILEAVTLERQPLWIFGAGHVGRAIVSVLTPFDRFDLTWVDTSPERFPATIPSGVTQLVAANPADLVKFAPKDAEHLILTYSHALDLELCNRLLTHGFKKAGLIGSHTKWSRFSNRLRQLSHSDAQISLIRCPIGQPELGKHPQAIAIGVAADLLLEKAQTEAVKDRVS